MNTRSDYTLVGLLLLLFCMSMDPVIMYIRRRWLDGDESRYIAPVKLFARFAYGIPIASALVLLFVTWREGNFNWVAALFLVGSALLGRYFHQRSRGRVARLPRMTVDPSDPEFQNDFHDFVVTIMALAWIVSPLFI